jgi:hypothetical protein
MYQYQYLSTIELVTTVQPTLPSKRYADGFGETSAFRCIK